VRRSGIYTKYIPSLINIACGLGPFAKQRKKIIPLATGNVLEIGIGTGLNLPLYDNKRVIRLTQLTLLKILGINVPLIQKARIYFKFMIASAEELPFDDGGFDTVVVTYSFALSLMQKALEDEKSIETNRTSCFVNTELLQKKGVQKVQDLIIPLERSCRMQFK
jgi:hypothetical protein